MATSGASLRRPAREVGPAFYFWISLLIAAIIVGGFSRTVPDDFGRTPAMPLLMHVHGAVFTAWVLLFVSQPAFVARGSLALHRRIGWIGAALAAAMVVVGTATTLLSIHDRSFPPFFPAGVFLVMNVVGIVVFGALVAAAIRLRRRREWHKRLMLCATISIIGPGFARLVNIGSFGAAAPLVILAGSLAFVAAGMIADRIVRGQIHPAYLWGAGAILFVQAAIVSLAFTPPTRALVALIEAA